MKKLLYTLMVLMFSFMITGCKTYSVNNILVEPSTHEEFISKNGLIIKSNQDLYALFNNFSVYDNNYLYQYDEQFFDNHVLYVIADYGSSSSTGFEVKKINATENRVTIVITKDIPKTNTTDIIYMIQLVEINLSDYSLNQDEVEIHTEKT